MHRQKINDRQCPGLCEHNFFTAANGDRASAANYYVFAIDGVRSGASIQGEFITNSWPNTIFAIGKCL